ncbi:anthrax toxin lethal factor-related metalloendopeptidase [Cytobacillus sp. Hm23]
MMKKMTLLLCIFVPFLTIPSSANQYGVLLKNYHPINDMTVVQQLSNYEYIKEILLLPNEEFDERAVLNIIQSLNRIDSAIMQKLVNNKVYVKLFNGSIVNEPFAKHLAGVRPRGYVDTDMKWDSVPGMGGNYVVLVKIGHSDKGQGHGSHNLELHELAHSIDAIVFDNIRHSMEFLAAWNSEVSTIFPNQPYFNDYPEEFFAEAFAMYYTSDETRELLVENAPLTAKYIRSLRLMK